MNKFHLRPFLAGFFIALCAVFLTWVFMRPTGIGIFRKTVSIENTLPSGAVIDKNSRLIVWPGKREITCPQQDKKTIVLLLLGQSNAGNHGGEQITSKHPERNFNYYAGKCFSSSSPLLGATGQGGEPWTFLADHLIDSGVAKTVVLVPLAVSGSAISRWIPGGDLNKTLQESLVQMLLQYQPTHVLWVQGESDFARQTPAEIYISGLQKIVQSLRKASVSAPIYIAVSSKCVGAPRWEASNDIANAQRASVATDAGIFQGPDLDKILDGEDRYDGCHLSGRGIAKAAQAWATTLLTR